MWVLIGWLTGHSTTHRCSFRSKPDDASAHVSEETNNSHTAASKGMIYSMLLSIVGGWLLLIAYFVCIQDYEATLATSYGFPVTQILVDCAGVNGATVLLVIITVGSFACGVSAMTANSRMTYSFARDGGLPKSLYWTHPTTKLPLRTIWVSVAVCGLLQLTAIGSPIVLYAFNSVCTIGFNTAYVMPIFVKLTLGKDVFKQAEFNLGKWSNIVGWIAVAYVSFLFVLLCFPTGQPVSAQTANYAPLMIGSVLIGASIAWVAGVRKVFRGPVVQISEEEIKELEDKIKAQSAGAVVVGVASEETAEAK